MKNRVHKRSVNYSSEFVRVERLIPGFGYLEHKQFRPGRGVVEFDHMHHRPYAALMEG